MRLGRLRLLGKFRPQGKFRLIALILGCIAGIAGIAVGLVLSPSVPTATAMQVGAVSSQTSTVGALFDRMASGQLRPHYCTGSVVDSPAGDLVITAAHCLAGKTPSQLAFIPDYAHGHGPYGVWTVSQIIEDRQWMSSSDPDDDFAFLIVHQPGSAVAIQALTGGEALRVGESAGQTVRVAGYPDDLDTLITCENLALNFSPTQLRFDCGGFTDGTSGSPLIARTGPFGNVATVIGVIGGYQQGGDTPSVSYAAKFSTQMAALYQTALTAADR
jgi:V8-like Glu-specific endopeptidase